MYAIGDIFIGIGVGTVIIITYFVLKQLRKTK